MTGCQHHYARVNGVRVHYVDAGSGPPVVLLHGFPETHRSWDVTWPTLVEHGYRVIAPDLRGYGYSARPADGYDLDTLSDDIAALIEHLELGPTRVIGHDWGGAIAWQVATRHASRVARAIILDCPHPVLLAEALRSNRNQLRRSWYMFFFQLPLLPKLWLLAGRGRHLASMWRDGPLAGRAPRATVDAQRESLRSLSRLSAPLAYYRTAFRTNAAGLLLGQPPSGYSKIEVPVTLIWGAEDSCLGQELIAGHERFTHQLRVHVIPEAGHFVHQEAPELVNPLLLAALGAP